MSLQQLCAEQDALVAATLEENARLQERLCQIRELGAEWLASSPKPKPKEGVCLMCSQSYGPPGGDTRNCYVLTAQCGCMGYGDECAGIDKGSYCRGIPCGIRPELNKCAACRKL